MNQRCWKCALILVSLLPISSVMGESAPVNEGQVVDVALSGAKRSLSQQNVDSFEQHLVELNQLIGNLQSSSEKLDVLDTQVDLYTAIGRKDQALRGMAEAQKIALTIDNA